MSLPSNFVHTEHFQSVVRNVYNDDVRDWFIDLGGDDWPRDIQTSRGSMRVACTHEDNDSFLMTVGRMLLFDNAVRRQSTSFPAAKDNAKHSVVRRSKPKLTLHFWEDAGDVEPGYDPVRGSISFRLMDQSPTTISRSDLLLYAQRIKSNFAVGQNYVWRKGKTMYSYTDWESGYQLQLLCRDKATAKDLIQKTLEIQGHVPNWTRMNTIENEEPSQTFPTIPPTEVVLGEAVQQDRKRPMADVRFRYASLELGGLRQDIILLDTTGLLSNPIAS